MGWQCVKIWLVSIWGRGGGGLQGVKDVTSQKVEVGGGVSFDAEHFLYYKLWYWDVCVHAWVSGGWGRGLVEGGGGGSVCIREFVYGCSVTYLYKKEYFFSSN